MIRARGVTVRFGDATIVDEVDVVVPDGGWLGLLGPNGAGKTTLLRALAGLVRRSAGAIEVAGIDPGVEDRRTIARTIAFVDQRPTLPPGMRVRDYVLLGRTAHVGTLRMETARDLEVSREAMARLDVDQLGDRDVLTLSGGEAQRVVLARALAQEAPVLLLDEPTSALDLGHKQQVLELVDELRRERDLTVVTTMHDLTVAGQFAFDMALLAGGRLVATGSPAEVLDAATLWEHFGARVQVLDDGCGGRIVVPLRTTANLTRPTALSAEPPPAPSRVPSQGVSQHDSISASSDTPWLADGTSSAPSQGVSQHDSISAPSDTPHRPEGRA